MRETQPDGAHLGRAPVASAVARSGNTQSVARVLDVLEVVAAAGGELALSEIAAAAGLPLPTIHRLVRTLVDRGYMRQLPSRRYALGSRLIPLGEVAGATLGTWARPVLAHLVDELGESANLAVLDGDRVTYIGQVASRHSMRVFAEVGRRVSPHSTGAGKALLSQLSNDQVRALLARTGMPAQTAHTITDPDALLVQLQTIRELGYALDEGEHEIGVRCVAVPVTGHTTRMSVSISGPSPRMTAELVERAIPLLRDAGHALSAELAERTPA
jgi:IclR family acetate operon transcriptional repressor